MPELPEVEHMRSVRARHAPGHLVQRVETLDDLGPEDRARLFSAMRYVLSRWVEGYGSLPRGWPIHARGRTDRGCHRCDTTLSRTVVGGRTTYFRPTCQGEASG